MAILTSNPEYTKLKTSMNTAIKNFVKNNPNSVKYSTTEAGKAVITLFFGETRDVELKDLAKICMETLNDADFVIDGIPVTVVKSSESYLVFEGEKAAVEAAIKTKATDYPILVIATNQVEEFNVDTIVTSIKNGIINAFVENRSANMSDFSIILEKSGITVDENSVTGRVIINNDKLTRYISELSELESQIIPNYDVPESSTDDESDGDADDDADSETDTQTNYLETIINVCESVRDIVSQIIRMKRYNKPLLNGDLTTKLNAVGIGLERVNEDSITFTYSLEKYSETKKENPDDGVEDPGVVEDADGAQYKETEDSEPVKEKTYYVADGDNAYRAAEWATDFDSTEESVEEDVYTPTEDPDYDENKTYYVEEAGGYRVTTDDDYTLGDENSRSFKPDVEYYEHSTVPGDPETVYQFKSDVTYYEKL